MVRFVLASNNVRWCFFFCSVRLAGVSFGFGGKICSVQDLLTLANVRSVDDSKRTMYYMRGSKQDGYPVRSTPRFVFAGIQWNLGVFLLSGSLSQDIL